MQASVVIAKATAILQDAGFDRTSEYDFLGWLNSARRLLVMVRPDANTARALITLIDGPHQTLPEGALRLIKIVRNETGRGVGLISEEQLTDFDPSWYTGTKKSEIKHYVFDELEPKAFDVYPPAIAGTKVLGVWSVSPQDIAAETDSIGLDDIYEPALVLLTAYFACLKDTEEQNMQAMAASFLSAGTLALTGKSNADEKTSPAASQPAKVRPNVR